jgi:hypothetical protein
MSASSADAGASGSDGAVGAPSAHVSLGLEAVPGSEGSFIDPSEVSPVLGLSACRFRLVHPL